MYALTTNIRTLLRYLQLLKTEFQVLKAYTKSQKEELLYRNTNTKQ